MIFGAFLDRVVVQCGGGTRGGCGGDWQGVVG